MIEMSYYFFVLSKAIIRYKYVEKEIFLSFLNVEKQFDMIEEVICQLFSTRCNLKSLQLDHRHDTNIFSVLRSFLPNDFDHFNSIQYKHRSSCVTLRRLYIRLGQAHFIENLIERLPNLKEMSVECFSFFEFNALRQSNLQTLTTKSNENWLNKVNEMRFFS